MDKLILYYYSPFEEAFFDDANSLFIGLSERLCSDFCCRRRYDKR